MTDICHYEVKPGDELYRIMRAHFGDAHFLADKKALVEGIQANNPWLKNIDMILPGQTIALPALNSVQSVQSAQKMPLLSPADLPRAQSEAKQLKI